MVAGLFFAYFACALVYSFPVPPNPTLRRVQERLTPIMRIAGIWQGWTMFAPEPPVGSEKISFELTLEDGALMRGELLRPHLLGPLRATVMQRHTKWVNGILQPSAKALWPDFARNMLRRAQREGLRPVQVRLYSHLARTAPPDSTAWIRHMTPVDFPEGTPFVWLSTPVAARP